MKQKFSITKEDWENSGKVFLTISNCPATIAVKRQLDRNFTLQPNGSIIDLDNNRNIVGKHFPIWEYDSFLKLQKGIEFHTEIELYAEV